MLETLLALNQIPRLHAKNIQPFRDHFGSLEVLFKEKTLKELEIFNKQGERLAQDIREIKKSFHLSEEIRFLERHQIEIIGFEDSCYPSLLLETASPPLVLYKKGPLPIQDCLCLGIVGSRNASFYGLETAEQFAREISEVGITIASGLARGIDTYAHRGALRGEGKTIAVIGSGMDIIYPKENAKLFNQIAEEGAVISEFPIGMRPFSFNFPRRNRIIAGLSKGVLVVEASERSGSLITSRFALEEGRNVYSIPGKIDFFGSKGNNRLIKEGAQLVDRVKDILDDFHLPERKITQDSRAHTQQIPCLNEEESLLLSSISTSPISLDELTTLVQMPVHLLQRELTALELQAKIQKLPGGQFVRIS